MKNNNNKKVISLKEAISDSLHDKDTVAFAGSGGRISIAAAYEIMRQKRKHLSFASAGTGAPCLDLLVGAGAVDRAEISFTMVVCLNIKRAIEGKQSGRTSLKIEDYSNLAMSLRFFAGATKIPFVPIMSLRGSDLERLRTFKGKEKMALMTSPFKDRSKAMVLPPCTPDVGIMHAQYADEDGNVLAFGPDGSDGWLLRASKYRVVTVEKIVSKEYSREHRADVYLPGFMVDAVCQVPYGAHPYGLVNCYDLDASFQKEYSRQSETQTSFDAWAKEWVFGINSRDEYLDKVGREKLQNLSTQKFLSSGGVF